MSSSGQASVDPGVLARMSNEDLATLTEQPDFYDGDTVMAAAEEYDRRNPVDQAAFTKAVEAQDSPAGRAGVFDSLVPDEWLWWAATAQAPTKKNNKREQAQSAYLDHAHAQYLRAEETTRGNLFKPAFKLNQPFDAMRFFDGGATPAQIRKYASEELLRFFANDPRMSFAEYAYHALGWESYREAAERAQSTYLSEHG